MNLLITGAWQQAEAVIPQIEQMGHKVAFLRQETDELPCPAEWVEGIIGNGLFLSHPIDQFVNLRYIQLTSAGFDRVPMKTVREKGIEIHNARGVYSIPMAEFAVAGVLSLYKGLGQFQARQQKHEWVKNRSIRELCGKNVLIVGCGSVGTECAKRFGALGCHVDGVDIAVRDDARYRRIYPLENLDDVLPGKAVVILTLPLTDETRGLIGRERLELIRGSVLVNIARGAIVDQEALAAWDGEAVLDVFEDEPLDADSPLWDKPGFLLTPHNSFVGDGNGERLKALIMGNMMGQIE